jgi:hypothetical protein
MSSSSQTIFKCSRCGYDSESLREFKKHLERVRECNPKESDISLQDVKQQYKDILDSRSGSPKRKKKRSLRIFGNESLDYLSKSDISTYVSDPLKGIQEIIKAIYFHKEHDENHTIRTINEDTVQVEIYTEDGWVKVKQRRVFPKMIYKASDIMEYNIPKKHWTAEFKNFIEGMGELDNDELLGLIVEELSNTIAIGEKELAENEPNNT